MSRLRPLTLLALVATAQITTARPGAAQSEAATTPQRVRTLLSALADDSMEGRGTGTRGSLKAARYIADRMREAGLTPAGDSGFFQRIPVAMVQSTRRLRDGTEQTISRPVRFASFADLDTIPAERRLTSLNVVGIIRGTNAALDTEAVLVDAHYDHLGIRTPSPRDSIFHGDSIYNGADDDASGTVAVLEIARAIAAGPKPQRTIIFLATTGEEVGLVGTRWFIAHPVVPLNHVEANLEIEMIGRPDSLAGGPGRGWLTGYERSTMGETFARAGLPIVADARPDQNFFQRSDNIAFAQMGIVAHTLSSFNLHGEYHTPKDEVSLVDFDHMAGLINVASKAVRLIADGPRLEWHPGGKPEAPPRRPPQ